MERDRLLELIRRALDEGWAKREPTWTDFNLSNRGLDRFPAEITQLPQLRELDLSHNQLKVLPPELGRLAQLQSLDLAHNQLTTLRAEIGELSQLEFLDLTGNRLTALPPEIEQLTKLQSLDLGFNQLTVLPSAVGRLHYLWSLHLEENKLTVLPKQIGQLHRLQSLHLGGNQLTTLPPQIGQLSHLQTLDLGTNQLTFLPPEISQLAELRNLHLGGNQLTALPPEIGRLDQLRYLDLSNNKLEALPPTITQMKGLLWLNLEDNPLPVPPEILAQAGDPETIIETYLDFVAGQRQPLNEVKMVLVGQGGVGKTCVVNRLLDGTFDPPDKTRGIDIRGWQVANPVPSASDAVEDSRVRVNVWDFGGQEIMHATHQFFLTKRSVYVLVLDNRLSEAENRLEYWLRIIRSFGGNSPVILVGNKADQQPLDIDRVGIRDKYPSIKDIVEVSCLDGRGIDRLQAAIASEISSMPHVFDELLATWFAVKAQLEQMDADYIPYAQYVRMCQEAGVTKDQSRQTLLSFLHDLGIILHFPDPRLETTNILNPEWVTQGVYCILNSHALFQAGGVLTRDLLADILDRPEYPPEKHMFIVDMMRKFELCYPFPGQAHAYLVPDLLPKEEMYTGQWDDTLTFQVHYNVLPNSIISRFIVRMHRYIKQNTVWRTGVLLTCEGNEALVRADLTDKRILIRVRGPASGRRDLLTRVREQLDAIHHTIKGLRAEEKVPLPGHPELLPVDYQWLRDMERKGISNFLPPGLTDPVSVSQLLNGVEPPAVRHPGRDAPTYSVDARGAYIGSIGDRAEIPNESDLLSEMYTIRKEPRMDPVSGAIVAGLVSGAAEGLAAQAYQSLIAAIRRKQGEDGEVTQAVDKLEQRPKSLGRQEELETQVQASKAAQDPELLTLAERLIAALEESEAGQQALSKYNIQMRDSQVGVVGDHAHVEGGMHFGDSSDTFNMSGDFRGAFVNIKSRLENVSQTVGRLPDADPSTKAELDKLISKLDEALQQVPPDKAEDAEAVAQSAEALVETASQEKPNKTMVEITGEGLKKAAQNLADVAPIVLTIATQIVDTVVKLVAQR